MRKDGYAAGLLKGIANVFSGGLTVLDEQLQRASARSDSAHGAQDADDRPDDTTTIEVDPPAAHMLHVAYVPELDGDPDAGEVIWTWVPYAEHDGRGKDRPVLVIGRKNEHRVYAVRLTSTSHDGDRDFLPLGSGPWDSKGRPSWVDIEHLYAVHTAGMRREGSVLDLPRFTRVARALQQRHGWTTGE